MSKGASEPMTSLSGVKIDNEMVREIVRAAIDQGWTVVKSKNGHIIIGNPSGGRRVPMTTTKCGVRAALNYRASARRAGLDL